MISKKGNDFDVIIISGEYYDDHPSNGIGIIARVLDAKGYSVGIIEKPTTDSDYLKLGTPKLGFCISAGAIDSMLCNYTPLKKRREDDKYSKVTPIPDRAIILYCNKLKQLFKGSKLVIGGIEGSLRRFAHYDYWDNKVRRSIMLDSRADILVYGNGEIQIIEIFDRLREEKDLVGIKGTCVISKDVPAGFEILPSFEEVVKDKVKFCEMQNGFSVFKNLAQEFNGRYVLQFEYPKYTTEFLDWIYSLDYSRKLNPKSLLKMAKFSVTTHRGCIGNCSFCSIALHQGDKIISRSQKNILDEINKIVKMHDFQGQLDDLGGPSANMYGMDCISCNKNCLGCSKLDLSHSKIIDLMSAVRCVSAVKKVFVRSGVRFDLALNSKEYVSDLSKHHISGCLKIAPEHLDINIVKLMNKDNSRFDEFLELFNSLNKANGQYLKYYFMIGHPGESLATAEKLSKDLEKLRNVESVQLFTPTPMSKSTCMYWTSLDPKTLNEVQVVYDYNTKKKLKRYIID